MIAASVVDFPEPVGPVTSTSLVPRVGRRTGAPRTPVLHEKSILEADCPGCHGQFSSHAGTMGYVIAGNANSPLVRATQPGGSMYGPT